MVSILACTATWCGPCRAMHPLLNELTQRYQGTITVRVLDCDDPNDRETITSYRVSGVPTYILVKDGVEQKRQVGADRQALQALFEQGAQLNS